MPSRRQRILVIGQDPAMRALAMRALRGSGCAVSQAARVEQGPAALGDEPALLVVLDLAGLDQDGIETVFRQLRQHVAAPILVIARQGQAAASRAALACGAADFLSAPFSAEDLQTRAQLVLDRRGEWTPRPAALHCGSLAIDLQAQRLTRDDQPIALSRTDWALLEMLVRNRGHTLTHSMLLEQVWGEAYRHEHGYLRTYVNRLRSKIEADPRHPRYLQTVARIGYRFVIPEGQEAAPAGSSAQWPGRRAGLPLPPTSFVGRSAELAAIRAALQRPEQRLLTLTGPGGVGKTRLALQSAADAGDSFADGVLFISLAAARTPDMLMAALGTALHIRAAGDEPLAELVRRELAAREILLILDNCEQIRGAGPLLSDLLQICPGLKLLVTSRARLQLSGEHELVVPPLALPDLQRAGSVEELLRQPAAALFLDRARAATPDYALAPAEIPMVAQICARLDGLPLAIELAAAWSKLLRPAAIMARLDRPLDLLTGGVRDLPARQQTMRSTLAWSYELLSDPQRQLFSRLAIFVGGAALEAIEQLCAADDSAPMLILEALAALVDASLLQRLQHEELRFTMLETIRDFAREQLAESGALGELQRRHARYYAELAESAGAAISGPDQVAWLDRLEREHENLRAALEWAQAAGEGELLLRLAGSLWNFWHRHGHQAEGRRWLAEALRVGDQLPAAQRARALFGMGWLTYDQRDYLQASAYHHESLALFQRLEDQAGVSEALRGLGELTLSQGDSIQARDLFEQSLKLSRQLGNVEGQAWSLNHLGRVAFEQADYGQARALLDQSLVLFRRLQLQAGMAWSLHNLGRVALEQAAYAQARDLFAQSLALARTLGDKTGIAWALHNLGRVALEQADRDQARALLEQGLSLFRQLSDRGGLAWAHHTLGRLAADSDDRGRARAHFEESLALFEALGDQAGVASSRAQLDQVEL